MNDQVTYRFISKGRECLMTFYSLTKAMRVAYRHHESGQIMPIEIKGDGMVHYLDDILVYCKRNRIR